MNDTDVSHEHGGTDPGLALLRSLATLMGGSLQAVLASGGGACFTLALRMGA